MANVRGIVNLSTTDWVLLYTIPAGGGATLDIEVANLAGLQVSLSIAALLADNDPLNVTDDDIIRGPIKINDGVDYNPHHLVFPATYSIFVKLASAVAVNVSYSGRDGA